MEGRPKGELRISVSTLIAWLVILVLGQLLITQWTVAAAGNQDVIDYVSFAGTVVGMILAILAIVYSYLSNASQKEDSSALRSQIASFNDAIGRAQRSEVLFSGHIERLDEIRERMSHVVQRSDENREAFARVEAKVDSFASAGYAAAKAADQSSVGPRKFDVEAVLHDLVSRASSPQVAFYFFALQYLSEESRESNAGLRSDVFKIMKEDENRFMDMWFDGQITAYRWVLYDFGIRYNDATHRFMNAALLARANEFLAQAESESDYEVRGRNALRLIKPDMEAAAA